MVSFDELDVALVGWHRALPFDIRPAVNPRRP